MKNDYGSKELRSATQTKIMNDYGLKMDARNNCLNNHSDKDEMIMIEHE